jgi:hypothetical protein
LSLALQATRELLVTPKLAELAKGEWFLPLLRGDEYTGHVLAGKHSDDFDDPVVLDPDDYPDEARPALKQSYFIGGSDADVVLLWRQKDATHAICHAHPEGFWILGQDAIDFAERFARTCAGETLPPATLGGPAARAKARTAKAGANGEGTAAGDAYAKILAALAKKKSADQKVDALDRAVKNDRAAAARFLWHVTETGALETWLLPEAWARMDHPEVVSSSALLAFLARVPEHGGAESAWNNRLAGWHDDLDAMTERAVRQDPAPLLDGWQGLPLHVRDGVALVLAREGKLPPTDLPPSVLPRLAQAFALHGGGPGIRDRSAVVFEPFWPQETWRRACIAALTAPDAAAWSCPAFEALVPAMSDADFVAALWNLRTGGPDVTALVDGWVDARGAALVPHLRPFAQRLVDEWESEQRWERYRYIGLSAIVLMGRAGEKLDPQYDRLFDRIFGPCFKPGAPEVRLAQTLGYLSRDRAEAIVLSALGQVSPSNALATFHAVPTESVIRAVLAWIERWTASENYYNDVVLAGLRGLGPAARPLLEEAIAKGAPQALALQRALSA